MKLVILFVAVGLLAMVSARHDRSQQQETGVNQENHQDHGRNHNHNHNQQQTGTGTGAGGQRAFKGQRGIVQDLQAQIQKIIDSILGIFKNMG